MPFITKRLGEYGMGPIYPSSSQWPSGKDGPLLIDGTTYNLPNGSVKDYSSITIINGGILQIGEGNAWTVIGCSGDFICNTGSIKADKGTSWQGTYTKTAPDGTALSYTIVGSPGGDGGASDSGFQSGSLTAYGNGGGGGGLSTPPDATNSESGEGGEATCAGYLPGATGFGATGDSGTSCSGDFDVYGQGGAGGFRGYNGQGIYIKIDGTVTWISSSILANGQDGGDGGAGGNATASGGPAEVGAGGGGGASGGGGGKVFIDLTNATGDIIPVSDIDVSAGAGGSGGAAGLGVNFGDDGQAGVSGTAGSAGSKQVSTQYNQYTNDWIGEMPTQPSDSNKSILNSFIVSSLASGNLTKHDRLWIRGMQYEDNAHISAINPTSTPSAKISTPTWTQYSGYTGASSKGINTHFTPSVDGVNYTLTSACLWIYSLTNQATNNAAGLAASDAGFTNVAALFPRQANNKADGILNSGTDTEVTLENSMGLISVTLNSGVIRIYQNGTLKGSASVAPTGLSTHEIYELTWNLAGTLFDYFPGTIFASGIGAGTIDQTELFNEVSDLAAAFGHVNRVIFLGDSFGYGSGAAVRLNDRFTTLISNNFNWMEDNRCVPGQAVNQTTTTHFTISDVPTKTSVDKYLFLVWSMLNDASHTNGGTQSTTDTETAYQSIIDGALSKGWLASEIYMMNDYFILDTADVPLAEYLTFRTMCINLAASNGVNYIENYNYETDNGGSSLIVSATPPIDNHPDNLGHSAIATNAIANI